ncbi:hypothetical protein LTS15_010947 [Exophiala xenobiotica]|nr:hypothetical protein LTS15_010947 [Exophiala xenobiotica]
MATYKIQITNRSGDEASYFLACDTPGVSGLGPDAAVWSVVLASKIAVQANDIAILEAPASPISSYVICGSSPDTPLSNGLAVEFSEASPMAPPASSSSNSTTSSSPGDIFHVSLQDDEMGFSKAATAAGAPGIWCTVDTDPYIFSLGMNVYAGLAIAMPSSEDILPTTVWTIHPNSSYTIASPPPKSFKLGVGSYEPGTLISLQNPSSGQLAPIDFSTTAGHIRHALHEVNGLLNVKPP